MPSSLITCKEEANCPARRKKRLTYSPAGSRMANTKFESDSTTPNNLPGTRYRTQLSTAKGSCLGDMSPAFFNHNTMNIVKVKRTELLSKIKANRKTHRDLFLKAQVGYRKDVIDELDKMLSDARSGKNMRTSINIPAPEDHSEDYDCIISMLEMSTEKIITISAGEFQMYVMDNWGWKMDVLRTNSFYASKA